MKRPGNSSTLATRMAVWIAGLGVFAAAALAVTEYRAALSADRLALRSHVQMAREVVGGLLENDTAWDGPELMALLQMLKQTEHLQAVKLWDARGTLLHEPVVVGDWSMPEHSASVIWTVDRHSREAWPEHAAHEYVIYRLPLDSDANELTLEMAVNGAARHKAVVQATLWNLLPGVAVLAVATLASMFLMKHWVVRPMRELASCLGRADPEAIDEISGRLAGVCRLVSRSAAEALRTIQSRLLTTQDALRENEALFEFAPSPLLVMDDRGVIERANKRASLLLAGETEGGVQGKTLAEWVLPGDRQALGELLETLRFEMRAVQPIRLQGVRGGIEVLVDAQRESAPQSTDAYRTFKLRVSMQDQSRTLELHHRLEQHRRMLGSALNGLPGAIVMTDPQGKVVFHNRDFGKLMQRGPDQLLHAQIDQPGFWAPVAPVSVKSFGDQVCGVFDTPDEATLNWEADTAAGTLAFSVQPLFEDSGERVGMMWRIDLPVTAASEKNEAPLASIKPAGLDDVDCALHEARSMSDLLECAVESLRVATGAEAAGIAIRAEMPGLTKRSRQLVSRGALPLSPILYTHLVQQIESDMMPDVLVVGRTVQWEQNSANAWGDAFASCGLGVHAASPLPGTGEDLGIIWLARREGLGLNAQAVSLMECVARLVAPRLEAAALREQLASAELMDPVTWLPTRDLLLREMARRESTPTRSALIVLNANGDDAHQAHPASMNDELLSRAWADRLRARCRRNTYIASLGPGQFAVFVRGLEPGFAAGLAQRLCEALRDVERSAEKPYASEWSAGVATHSGASSEDFLPGELLSEASDLAEQALGQGEGTVLGDASKRLRRAS